MSFLTELKNQIVSEPYKSVCCRRSLLNGMVFVKGDFSGANISLSLESSECIEFASSLIRELFGKDPEVITNSNGGRRKIISFKSPALVKYLNSLDEGGIIANRKCSGCNSAFLRGVFLACGRICDPQKQYRIEFAPTLNYDRLAMFLSESGLNFSKTRRRGENILYSGNSVTAEDFFAAIGMNSTTFLLMNSKIENEFKNTANRIRNCETNNIMKTVSASARWVSAIEALDKANLLSNLPEELERTARLRLEFKDYSLARLALEFTPPISKPGLSHRLNKIVEISENLLSKENDI